jgi:uncharacterized membrane protein (UPF0136 family)
MSTTFQSGGNLAAYQHTPRKISVITRFFDWAAKQDAPYHIGWVGVMVMSMTALFFPLTMAIVLSNGPVFGLIIATMCSLVLVVVSNLASMPTKFTIPFFVLGILMDLVVVVLSFFIH